MSDIKPKFNFSLEGTMILSSTNKDFKFQETPAGDIRVDGWFITEDLVEDREPRIKILASAFKKKRSMERYNGRVLAFHDRMREPIGKIESFQILEGEGVRGQVTFFKENTELMKRSIREGVLDGFSIGIEILKYEFDEEEEILTVTDLIWKEVSAVNIGAVKKAKFKVLSELMEYYELNRETETEKTQTANILTQRSITLAENNKKEFNQDVFMQEHEQYGLKISEMQGILTAVKDAQNQLNDRTITKAEFASKIDKMAADLERMRVTVEEAKTANATKEYRLQYQDYRSLITDLIWLTDDNGNKLGKVAQQAHCLFQLPVDYKNMENGQDLKNLRDLHDAVIIADAMNRFKSRDRYSIQSLGLFKQLVEATKKFDKDVALAMAGGNSGFGAEWLPIEMSAEFNEFLRLQPSLVNRFAIWNMPKGGSAKFPFQNGRAVVYKGGEALTDNAEEARKTNVATGVKLFTPDVFIGALVASEELTEDTILDMVAFIRMELAKALLEGLESALINGDDSTTHFDNADQVLYQSYNVETAFKGLRKLGITNARDVEASSPDSGVGALVLQNFIEAKQDMEVAGIVPQDCVWVTGIKGKTAIQNALFKTDALGVLAFMISGTLPTIDGTEIHISGQYNESLASSGLYAPSTDTKHTSICCAHKPSFRIGQRRGVTLEFNKNIMTQQQQFVATARWDFGKISADSIKPVAEMINIQHTA